MSIKKKKTLAEKLADGNYYHSTAIDKTGAEVRLILGTRKIGKSFDVKVYGAIDGYKNKLPFVVLRRWAMDFEKGGASSYMGDLSADDWLEITDGQFNELEAKAGEYRLIYRNPDNWAIEKRSHLIGYYIALTDAPHIKSRAYQKCGRIIFEEFMSESYYLPQEEEWLWSIVSTVGRGEFIPLYMIGNQISRSCLYFRSWNLKGIPRQEAGTIEHYTIAVDYDQTERTLAVELCSLRDSAGHDKKYRKSKDTRHHWQMHRIPKEPRAIKELEKCWIFKGNMTYLLTFKVYEGHNYGILISPKTTAIQNNTRVIVKDIGLLDTRYKCSVCFAGLTPIERAKLERHRHLIYFSDSLTAEDWKAEGVTIK